VIRAIFDTDASKIASPMGIDNLNVQDVRELADAIRQLEIKVGIIATPAEDAQAVARIMADAGIKAILNYAPITLMVPGVRVQYIDPVVGLQRMTYYL